MNIIIYIDENRHLLGHSIEITCTEFELLVLLGEHIFLWDFKGEEWYLVAEACPIWQK